MKYFFLYCFVLLGLASVLLGVQNRPAPSDAKPSLVWVADNNPVRQRQLALFNTTHPDVQVRLDPSNRDMSKIILQCLGGVGPDLFECDKLMLGAFVQAGMVRDITEDLENMGLNLPRDVWPCLLDDVMIDGRAYGFPRNVSTDALWFDQDALAEQDITLPVAGMSWDEFIPLAQRLTLRDEKGGVVRFGFIFEWWQWQRFVKQWGGRIYNEAGTRCVLDSPQVIAAITFMHDLIYRYGVAPSPQQESAMTTAGGWGSGGITWFGGKRAATALGGRWWLCTLNDPGSYPDLHFGVVHAPQGPSGRDLGYGGAVAINRFTQHPDLALEFIRFMAGPDYNRLVYQQGDGLPAVMKWAQTVCDETTPTAQADLARRVWLEPIGQAVPEDVSPFIEQSVMARIVTQQLDLVKADQKPPAQAMRDATAQVNREIARRIERNQTLRAEYERREAKGAQR